MSEAVNQIKIGAALDGTFDTTIQSGKRKMGELGAAAREAGKGTGAIGDGMAGSAQKVEAATKNMVGSIQRQIAALEAGDKSSRQYQESLARMRGIDTAALKPYLDQLDAVKAKQAAAVDSSESVAKSVLGIKAAYLAASAAVGGFALAVKAIVDSVDALNDLKDATGASIENISALEDVSLRTGGSFDTVSTSLIKLNKGLADAKPGSDMAIAINAIGLSVDDLKKLDPAEAFRKTAVALSGFADDANKARLTQELFGKSLQEVAPFLKDLAEKGELVAKVTTEQADEAERFNKSLFEMQKNVTDISRGLAGPLVTALNEVIAKFKEGSAEGKGFMSIASDRYWSNIRKFYGMEQPVVNTGGAGGEWGEDAPKPSAPDVGALAEKEKAAAKAREEAAKAAARALEEQNKALADQAKLLAELSGLTGSFSKDWADLSAIYKRGEISLDQLTEAQAKLLAKQPFAIAEAKASADLIKAQSKAVSDGIKFMQAENKAYEDHAKVLRTSEKAVADYADSAKLMADDLVFETKLIGLNTAERERAIEQRKIQLELDKEIHRINDTAGLTFEEKESQKAIAMQAAVSKASTAAARSSLNEWAKTAESIRDSLVDAFDSAILTGKDLFTSLRDAAVKLFDGLVLRPILQGVLSPVATALTGSLIGTAANAATGASATSGLLSGVTGIGASAGAGSITSLLGSSGMGALDIMGFDPTTIGIALGVAFLSSLGGKFVSATDSGRARVDYNASGIGGSAYSTTGDAAQIAAATKNTNTLAKTYYDTAKALGITAMQAAFEVGTNTGREGAAPQTVLGVNIGKASYSSGEIASGDAAGLQLAASRAVLTALQASTLPSYLAGAFDDITASTATQEQITAALTGASALKAFHDQLLALPFKRVADLSYEATQGLIAASGGLDKLASNLGDYYSNFYTSEEQRQQTIANINAATAGSGLDAATATRESFRALVESQDLTTESGRKTYTALIGVAGAFASITPAATDAAKAIREAAASIYSAQTSQYDNFLSAQQAQSDYAEQAAQASQQAAQESAQAAQQAAQAITQAFAQAGQGIADFVKTLLGEIANPATLQSNYLSDLSGAKGGDLQASQRLPASARAYLDSQIANSATSSEANIARARMAAELSRLPAVKTYEQQSLDALNAIGSGVLSTVTAVQDLNGKLIVDLNVKAQSELLKILKFTADTAGLSPEVQALALMTVSTLDKTIALAVKQQDPYALAVALAQGGTVNTLFTVSGGDLTPEQLALINGIEKYNKNVLIGVRIDATELTALQQQLMTTFGTIDLNALGGAGVDITSVVNQGALSRLNSISTYIRTLDWSDAGKGASAWATYDAARAYGVTQGDIASAMGLKYTDIQALFDTYNIPRFAAGSNYLPDDMLAQVHQGERIIPAADNRELMQRLQNPQENSAALVTEIKALREENRAQASAMVQMQQRLTKLMERWDGSGLPSTRIEI